MSGTFLKCGMFITILFASLFMFVCSAQAQLLCGCSTMQQGGSRENMGILQSESLCNEACRTAENSDGTSKNYRFYSFGGLTRPLMAEGSVRCNCSSGRDTWTHEYEADVYSTEMGLNMESNCEAQCRIRDAGFFSYSGAPYKEVGEIDNTNGGAQMTNRLVPGQRTEGGIIKCGRPGQQMCTLCDLVKGINAIVQFLMKISIGIALLAITIGGIMYIISSGDSGMMDMAKSAIKNALIGFVLVFSAYLIINTTIVYLGTKPDLGINAQWGTFDCNVITQ